VTLKQMMKHPVIRGAIKEYSNVKDLEDIKCHKDERHYEVYCKAFVSHIVADSASQAKRIALRDHVALWVKLYTNDALNLLNR